MEIEDLTVFQRLIIRYFGIQIPAGDEMPEGFARKAALHFGYCRTCRAYFKNVLRGHGDRHDCPNLDDHAKKDK